MIFVLLFSCGLLWLIATKMVRLVAPGGSQVLCFFDGSLKKLDPGIHLLPSPFFSRITNSPWRGLLSSPTHDLSSPNRRILLNPPPVQLQTADAVPGVADVAGEARVLNTCDVQALVNAQGLSFRDLSQTRINQWVSNVLGRVEAADLTYLRAMEALNAPEELAALNKQLSDCHMAILRVSVDPDGVKLSPTFTTNLERSNSRMQQLEADKKALERQLEVQAVEAEKERLACVAAAERRRIEAEAQLAVAKIARDTALQKTESEQARVTALMSGGLEAHAVAALLVAECASETLSASGAEKLIAVPPGLLGLHGVGAVLGGGTLQHSSASTQRGGDFVTVGR